MFKKTDPILSTYEKDKIVPIDYCGVTRRVINKPFYENDCRFYGISFMARLKGMFKKSE